MRRPDLYQDMGCIRCKSSDIESWEHFISCDPYNDLWNNLYKALALEIQTLFIKYKHDDVNFSQVDQLIVSLIGLSADSITFRLFKQHACEGKFILNLQL